MRELIDFSESKRYLCEYKFANSKWVIEIDAVSHEEAEERLKSISNGKVLGEIQLVIPIKPKWIEKIFIRVVGIFKKYSAVFF